MKPPPILPKLPFDRITQLNHAIALRSNAVFASMGFFWLCLVFSLLPLKWPATMPFVQYASSGVLQLIALPLLGVGTLLAAQVSDQMAKEQHAAVMETVSDLHALMKELHEMHLELTAKVEDALDGEANVPPS